MKKNINKVGDKKVGNKSDICPKCGKLSRQMKKIFEEIQQVNLRLIKLEKKRK